ncbi:MFS transporter [Candidatus Bathyarchaeota archaeon]|nr:MFS transporter [Candidatus Bathyarchaeota archaeon]
MDRSRGFSGLKGFTVVWLGQLISFLGTGMTQFALTIWAWEKTGEATSLALVSFAYALPYILASPLAGALVDRWDRKLVTMISDIASGVSTLILLLLLSFGRLEVWHLYITSVLSGAFQAFQFPAFSTLVTLMLDKEQYSRANGMLSLARSASGIFAPVAAGILLPHVKTGGIMVFDALSFMVAVLALAVIDIPQPRNKDQEKANSLLEDSVFGFKYIFQRSSLLGLQGVFFVANFSCSISFALLAPMILSRTGDNVVLGVVQSAFGIGGVVGGLFMSAWGGPRRKVDGLLMGISSSCLFSVVLMGLGRGLLVWAVAAFMLMFINPITNGCSQAIWQSKVPPEYQGRVFATRALIAQASQPVALLIAGPMADRVMEPAMMSGGLLAPAFGWLVGVGPGAGMALIFVLTGLAGTLAGLGGYMFSSIRDVEKIIPDHDQKPSILAESTSD